MPFAEPGVQPIRHLGQRPDFRAHPGRLNRPRKRLHPALRQVGIRLQPRLEDLTRQDRRDAGSRRDRITVIDVGPGRGFGKDLPGSRAMQDQPKPMACMTDEIGAPVPEQHHRHHLVTRTEKGLPGGEIPLHCIGKKVFEYL